MDKFLLLCGVQSSPNLCDPMDCSLLGSSVHGIFQARTLEWVVISYSRVSSWPGIKHMSVVSLELASVFFTTVPAGKPQSSCVLNSIHDKQICMPYIYVCVCVCIICHISYTWARMQVAFLNTFILFGIYST